jgi:7-keto-8-aminopelargonate synthetase-like enzyme
VTAPKTDHEISLSEPLAQAGRVHVQFRGRKLIYFGGCDYYRLASNAHLKKVVVHSLQKDGLNVAASRVTTGNHPIYEQLEAALRGFFKVDAALLTSTGYTANLVIAQALAGGFSHVMIDERAHASLKDAAQFFNCPIIEYKHRDPVHATQGIARCGKFARIALLTDGVFAHDGSIAPVPQLISVLPSDGMLLLDDAHGAGVLGKNARGTAEHFSIRNKRIVRSITLSKAFGAFGGAVLAGKTLCEKIVSHSRLFAGSTPPPLPLARAAIYALANVQADASLRARLKRNTKMIGREFPIISLVPTSDSQAVHLKRDLLKAAIFPSLIHYPGGPRCAYFRFAISSEHTPEQIERLLGVLRKYQ